MTRALISALPIAHTNLQSVLLSQHCPISESEISKFRSDLQIKPNAVDGDNSQDNGYHQGQDLE